MTGLFLLNGFFWWQEARKDSDQLSVRGRSHRRMTFLFGALAVFIYFSFR